jgi:hypothetical protein
VIKGLTRGLGVDVEWDGRRDSDGGMDGGRDKWCGRDLEEEWRKGWMEEGPRIHPLLPFCHLFHLLSDKA